ncbi:MAG TPA: SH3 domain-containing protein [Gemmatimonadales bacterium]
MPPRSAVTLFALWLALAACSKGAPEPAPAPVATTPARVVTETVTVRDHDLEQRVSRQDLQLLDKDAQIEELQTQLDEARREVLRSMAKVQTLATRAEAASAMAEAEIALQTLRRSAGGQAAPEVAKAAKLYAEASDQFNKQNYGGALWLANQAKTQAGLGRRRFTGADPAALRPGEQLFAVPLRLQTVGRSKLREGPGTGYRSLVTLEAGRPLTAFSFVDQWMRVSDDSGRSGWVFYNLVRKRPVSAR